MIEEISFGRWLSRQRKSLGYTQKQLANMVNCAIITLRKIEGEQRRPSVQLVKRLAKVLNIPEQEHEAFSKYARRDDPAASITPLTDYPWQQPAVPIQPNMLSTLLSHFKNSLNLSQANGISLGEQIHLDNQYAVPAGMKLAGLAREIIPAQLPETKDSVIIVLLVPIELPASLARQLFGNPGKNDAMDRSRLH